MNLVVDNTVEETGGEKIEMGMVVSSFIVLTPFKRSLEEIVC